MDEKVVEKVFAKKVNRRNFLKVAGATAGVMGRDQSGLVFRVP